MEDFKFLRKLGVDPDVASQYQILCLPENIENQGQTTQFTDSNESITLSKLLKEEGVKCANSYDLGLNAKISERRGVDIWLGIVWILNYAALPLLINVVGRLVGEKIQKKIDDANQLREFPKLSDSEERKVHVNLKFMNGERSTEIKYDGDADTLLEILKGINDER